MGNVRVSRTTRARLGYFTGVALIAVGVYLARGLGWALVAAGALIAAAFVWLYDVSEPADATTMRQEDTW